HPLVGSRLKVRRAKGEVIVLGRAIEVATREAKYQVVRAEFNPKTQKQVYRVGVERGIPPELGILIGEIAYNLRSALDGVAYQLALLNLPKGKTPTTQNQF